MEKHHENAFNNSLRIIENIREAVREYSQASNHRDSSLLHHACLKTPKWSDRATYGNLGPLTQSGVFPHSTEYQLAYNRGPLSPLQTVYPRTWTHKPHWGTSAVLNAGVQKEFPIPDRLRLTLDNDCPERILPTIPTLPSNTKNIENLMSIRRDAMVPEWTVMDPYRVNLVDGLKQNPTRKTAETLRLCQKENEIITNNESIAKQKLGDLVNNVNFWRREVTSESELLEKEIRNMDSMKQRIDREIELLAGPMKVSLDNTEVRRLKKSDNAVMYLDIVDFELSKEQDMLNIARDTYRLMAASLLSQNGISTLQSWAQNSNNGILRSQTTRAESVLLVQEAERLLKKASQDLWLQWSRVNDAFRAKTKELEDFGRPLNHRLTILNQELNDMLRDEDLLKKNIEEKQAPRLTTYQNS